MTIEIVDLPTKNIDFPCESLPEGIPSIIQTNQCPNQETTRKSQDVPPVPVNSLGAKNLRSLWTGTMGGTNLSLHNALI